MKKILSFFLVLCMLLAAVPALALPVFAEDDEVVVLEEHSFIEEFVPGVTYTISEVFRNQPIDGTPFATDEAYLEWLLSDGVFAVDQGDSNWKVGEFDPATGVLDPFARIAFCADDLVSQVTGNEDEHDMNWVITESRYQTLATNYVTGAGSSAIWNGNGIWHLHAGGVWKVENGYSQSSAPLAFGRITNSGDGTYKSAIQYTVPADGTYGVELGAFSDTLGGHAIAIYVNDAPVWPLSANKTSHNTWYQSSSTTTVSALNTLLLPLAVKLEAGDTISFVTGKTGDAMVWEPIVKRLQGAPIYLSLSDPNGPNTQSIKVTPGSSVELPLYQGDNIFFGWDVDGDGVADYADGATVVMGEESVTLNAVIMAPSKFYDERPYWDAGLQAVVNPGNWTFGAINKASNEFLPVKYFSAPFISPSEAGAWGAGFFSMYDGERPGVLVATGTYDTESGFTVEGKEPGAYIGSVRYTAQYNGTAMVDFDQLTIKRELNPTEDGTASPIIAGFAIYVDGNKVWPTGDKEYYWFSSVDVLGEEEGIFTGRNHQVDFYALMKDTEAWPFPVQVEGLEMGDTVDIRMVRGTPYNWGFYVRPTVTYTALSETPIVSKTSVDIDEDFDLNIFTSVLGKDEASVPHLEYWLAEPTAIGLQQGGKELELKGEENGMFKFTFEGLTAKQMSDVIYVRAYTTGGANGDIYGDVEQVSIQKYAQSAMGLNEKLDDLLVAMVNYGANAQALFGHNVDNPANAFLDEELQYATADPADLVDVFDKAEGDYQMKAVSLLLGNDIGMKFVVDSVEGATAYQLEISTDADFAESEKIDMHAAWEGKEQVATYHMNLGEIGETYYARVIVDGAEGATLTYSVDTYVIRISATECSESMFFTATALAYFGQMLQAYMA